MTSLGGRAYIQQYGSRPSLPECRHGVPPRLLALRESLRASLMDYIIAGIATVLIFGYLIYALLRPERF